MALQPPERHTKGYGSLQLPQPLCTISTYTPQPLCPQHRIQTTQGGKQLSLRAARQDPTMSIKAESTLCDWQLFVIPASAVVNHPLFIKTQTLIITLAPGISIALTLTARGPFRVCILVVRNLRLGARSALVNQTALRNTLTISTLGLYSTNGARRPT